MSAVELLIAGAGPAGIAAALAAREHGCSVLLVDGGARPGGQIWRQAPPGCAPDDGRLEPPSHHDGARLLDALARAGVERLAGATVFGGRPGEVEVEQHGRALRLRARVILLATGARDLVLPVPGWTLPGVLTAGAAQALVRGQGVRPGQRALVAGCGPLLLPTVASLLAAGCEVAGCFEAAPLARLARAAFAVLRHRARRREAWFYRRVLRDAGLRLRAGHALVAVEGDGRVERAIVAPLDGAGRPRTGGRRSFAVDLVCTGHGLQPQVELAALLGCALADDPVLGGAHVATGPELRTSVPGVLAAGECAGIGGADVARVEGELAGCVAARDLGRPVPESRLRELRRRRRRERRLARALLAPFRWRDSWLAAVAPDTIVCRCEDITRAELERAAAGCGRDPRAVKLRTRAGMGPCQSRTCGRIVAALLGADPRAIAGAVQWPLSPVPLATLVDLPAEEPG